MKREKGEEERRGRKERKDVRKKGRKEQRSPVIVTLYTPPFLSTRTEVVTV